MTNEERIDAAKKLRDAINHTKARLANLRSSLTVRTLNVLQSRLVAEGPDGDLYVAVGKQTESGAPGIAFCFAPLARPTEILSFEGELAQKYVEKLQAEFDAKEPGTSFVNIRFESKRAFNALLIPTLEKIVLDTEGALSDLERVTE